MSGALDYAAGSDGGGHWLDTVAEGLVPPSVAKLSAASPCDRTLLLVDDVAMNRDAIGAFLRNAGYVVRLAEGGRQAVQLASEELFALILMDVRMPEMDGLEAARRIRALPAPNGRTPMLALTAYAFPEQVAECRLAGMDGHVAKPVDHRTLIQAVDRTIAHVVPRLEVVAPATHPASDQEQPVRLDRGVLEKKLASLPPHAVMTGLQLLRVRAEQMVRLLDDPADLALLSDATNALGCAAIMFGFAALSEVSRGFQRAVTHDLPGIVPFARQLRSETCAALALLDQLTRETWMQPVGSAACSGGGVIVAEDDPLVRNIVRSVLRFAKQQVFCAADGLEAVILAREFEASLVLLDVSMPRLNGLLACEAIRALPGYAEVPIVMLTGHSEERVQHAAQRLGATEFITKPFRPDLLLERLERYLDGPVRRLRGVFHDTPAQASPAEACAGDDNDSLAGGWLKAQSARSGAPHVPLKGVRYSPEDVFRYAGIPVDLVDKWLGNARPSPVAIGCDVAFTQEKRSAIPKLRFLS